MESDEKLVFLSQVAPFNVLDSDVLAETVSTMVWEKYAHNHVVIRQGDGAGHFYVLQSGLVKVYLHGEKDKEAIIGFLGEGECFGEMSILTGGPTTASVKTIEPSVCLVQKKEDFLRLVERCPQFLQFFNQLMMQRMRNVYREILSKESCIAEVEPYLYTKQIRDMVSGQDLFADRATSIREVTRKLTENQATALVVLDEEKRPHGVINIAKIAKSVVLEGRDAAQPVEAIMDTEFHSVNARGYFFDALHTMIRNKTGALVVMDSGRTCGILTGLDLLRFRGREVLSLLRNIESAADLHQLNGLRVEVEKVLRALVADGALASQVCSIMSEFNDRIVRRVLNLVETQYGEPPSAYAWLGLGSEGRREQTLFTDQDNAIIFLAGPSAETEAYFSRFASTVVESLHQCGIPLCKGNVMASNGKWFGDTKTWRERLTRWASDPHIHETDLVDVYVFLDFRCVHGDPALEAGLRTFLTTLTRKQDRFLKLLAGPMTSIPIPVGFFKNFIVEKGGKHKDTLNVKLYGLVPLTSCIKILALRYSVAGTNTLERIKALQKEGVFSSDQTEILGQAFETFLTLKIRNNLNEIDRGQPLGNHVNPAALSTPQKQLLKDAFWAVSELQKITRNTLKVVDTGLGM